MAQEYDARKNAKNMEKHGIGFERVTDMDWSKSFTTPDPRRDYGEERFATFAYLGDRLHCLIWTWRDGVVRPISFRKANTRERKKYEKEI